MNKIFKLEVAIAAVAVPLALLAPSRGRHPACLRPPSNTPETGPGTGM
jgi:hypothetical protein